MLGEKSSLAQSRNFNSINGDGNTTLKKKESGQRVDTNRSRVYTIGSGDDGCRITNKETLMKSTSDEIKVAWSARCDCYHDHSSSSGRCNVRNVTDPTRPQGALAICESCRSDCPIGEGTLNINR